MSDKGKKADKALRTVSVEEQVRGELQSEKTLANDVISVSKVLFGKGMLGLREEFFVGRGFENDLTIEDDGCISRCHYVIVRYGTRFLIRDLGSRNGTFVNSQRIFEQFQPLNSGDVIRSGNSYYKFVIDIDMGALLVLISGDSIEQPEVDAATMALPTLYAAGRSRDMSAGH